MIPVGSVLVDFDGTACASDVSEVLLQTFGERGWERYDDLVAQGEMGLREGARAQASMLQRRPEMLDYAVGRAASSDVSPVCTGPSPTAPADDRERLFGFYVLPILRAAGLGHACPHDD